MSRTNPSQAPLPVVEESEPSDQCGDSCHWSSSISHDEIVWSEDELDALVLIIRNCPTQSACRLAVAMDKSCREVYAQRIHLKTRNPDLFLQRPVPVEVSAEESKRWLMRTQHTVFGCSHEGPCTAENGCSCTWSRTPDDSKPGLAPEAQYCQRSCSCGPACARRYPGCKCHKKSKVSGLRCETMSCLCVKRGRECEVGVCGHCDPVEGRKRCGNRVFGNQPKGYYKIAETKHGYGLFATTKILAGEPIGEYLAEAISDERASAYGVMAKHTGRNYVYDWSEREQLYLDAIEAGNATRFINHAEGKQANASAAFKWVNGDLKICVTAERNIGKNKEILMDYGENFFRFDSEEASLWGNSGGEEVLGDAEGEDGGSDMRAEELESRDGDSGQANVAPKERMSVRDGARFDADMGDCLEIVDVQETEDQR
ncbi:SET domain-containing protein [Auricularia subglabra TFB-10046 SS5]|nr:SET domain-containing protein [Auricularia subglabra TFB-10046 SS5]